QPVLGDGCQGDRRLRTLVLGIIGSAVESWVSDLAPERALGLFTSAAPKLGWQPRDLGSREIVCCQEKAQVGGLKTTPAASSRRSSASPDLPTELGSRQTGRPAKPAPATEDEIFGILGVDITDDLTSSPEGADDHGIG